MRGKELLSARLDWLRATELPKVISDISEAKKQGDLSENFEYYAAKRRKGEVEREIQEIEEYVKSVVVLKLPQNPTSVCFGCKVRLTLNGQNAEYIVLGDREADVDRGSISISCPLFATIVGKGAGFKFELNGKNGELLEVLPVSEAELDHIMTAI